MLGIGRKMAELSNKQLAQLVAASLSRVAGCVFGCVFWVCVWVCVWVCGWLCVLAVCLAVCLAAWLAVCLTVHTACCINHQSSTS